MSTPVDVERGASKFYVATAIVVVLAILMLVLGEWRAAVVAAALGGLIAGHPWMRRQWYALGYEVGYDDGRDTSRALER